MDEIINYLSMDESEKYRCISELMKTSFAGNIKDKKVLKKEMDTSEAGSLPQFVFVLRNSKVIGYMFLIAEKENPGGIFPWWAMDNADELPMETDIRLLTYGVKLCTEADCLILAERLKIQIENHKKGIGRRNEECF